MKANSKATGFLKSDAQVHIKMIDGKHMGLIFQAESFLVKVSYLPCKIQANHFHIVISATSDMV